MAKRTHRLGGTIPPDVRARSARAGFAEPDWYAGQLYPSEGEVTGHLGHAPPDKTDSDGGAVNSGQDRESQQEPTTALLTREMRVGVIGRAIAFVRRLRAAL